MRLRVIEVKSFDIESDSVEEAFTKLDKGEVSEIAEESRRELVSVYDELSDGDIREYQRCCNVWYRPMCPYGFTDCTFDPAYIRAHELAVSLDNNSDYIILKEEVSPCEEYDAERGDCGFYIH